LRDWLSIAELGSLDEALVPMMTTCPSVIHAVCFTTGMMKDGGPARGSPGGQLNPRTAPRRILKIGLSPQKEATAISDLACLEAPALHNLERLACARLSVSAGMAAA